MKMCKYCTKKGKFDRLSRKVLCPYHASLGHNIRHLWMAISDLQLRGEVKIQG